MRLVVVKRYDQPEPWFGLHSNDRTEHIFDTVGLFTPDELQERLENYGALETIDSPDVNTLIPCAPIEWHTAMKNGEMLDRFTMYTTTT